LNLEPPPLLIARREEDIFDKYLRGFLTVQYFRQFKVGKYRIDFFIPSFNLAIEFDEKHHQKAQDRINDGERQNFIEQKLKCNFLRVNSENPGLGLLELSRYLKN